MMKRRKITSLAGISFLVLLLATQFQSLLFGLCPTRSWTCLDCYLPTIDCGTPAYYYTMDHPPTSKDCRNQYFQCYGFQHPWCIDFLIHLTGTCNGAPKDIYFTLCCDEGWATDLNVKQKCDIRPRPRDCHFWPSHWELSAACACKRWGRL